MATKQSTHAKDSSLGDDVSPTLKRQLGLLSAGSFVTGTIVGVGIFVSPSPVLAGCASSLGLALLVWVAVGAISFCGALTFADLGSRIRKSGGAYTYIREAFGDLASFLYLWTLLVFVSPMSISVSCLATAQYILRPVFLACPELAPRPAKVLLALVVLGAMISVNLHSAKMGAAVQVISTLGKVSALVIVIVAGIVHLAQGNTSNFEDPFATEDLTAGGLAMAFYSAFYAYNGWDRVSDIVEEVNNPVRTIPLATLLGLLVTMVIYVTTLVAYHAVLTNETILSGVAVGVAFGESVLGPGKWLVLVGIAISASGLVNSLTYGNSRIFMVGARDGALPAYLSLVNVHRHTPQAAILTQAVLAVVYICLIDLTALGTYAFVRTAALMAAVGSVFRLRKKFPAERNAFQVHAVFPLIFMVFGVALFVVTILNKFRVILPSLVICLSAIPIHFLSRSSFLARSPLGRLHQAVVRAGRGALQSDFDRTV